MGAPAPCSCGLAPCDANFLRTECANDHAELVVAEDLSPAELADVLVRANNMVLEHAVLGASSLEARTQLLDWLHNGLARSAPVTADPDSGDLYLRLGAAPLLIEPEPARLALDQNFARFLRMYGDPLEQAYSIWRHLRTMRALAVRSPAFVAASSRLLWPFAALECIELERVHIDRFAPSTLSSVECLRRFHVIECGLVELPASLARCHRLVELVVRHNRLTTIEPGLTRAMPTLQRLELDDNELEYLSAALLVSHELELVSVPRNRLVAFPFASIAALPKIRRVDVSANPALTMNDAQDASLERCCSPRLHIDISRTECGSPPMSSPRVHYVNTSVG